MTIETLDAKHEIVNRRREELDSCHQEPNEEKHQDFGF